MNPSDLYDMSFGWQGFVFCSIVPVLFIVFLLSFGRTPPDDQE